MLLALEVEGKKSMQVTKTESEQPKQFNNVNASRPGYFIHSQAQSLLY